MSAILHGCLPDTEYLEVESRSGNRYGIWITTPPGYEESSESVPLVYVLDGNWTVGFTAPLIVTQRDPYLSIAPYIQVTVGYAGDEASDWARLRNRDLVPPGEPIGDDVVAALESARETGAMSQGDIDAYIEQHSDCNADTFLDFLTDELHPRLHSHLRVSDTGHGLFGFSYGGLFALYAWLRGGTPFSTVGAGTPGISSADSQLFDMIGNLPEASDDGPGAGRLHVTLNKVELWGDVPVYRGLARNVLRALEGLRAQGRSELLSTSMLDETHVTGVQASFLSYLKECHVR
ncbi:alpha/beta hydrolase [Rhodococcoides fascians]|uniref:alpha/beta hydrolase n=2 Tax=Nocardiaceae TaxID=85025 RepID=UPI0005699FBA|nr:MULTISPECIES: alpha/beta hydrolase-fold protein [Rhodococcus]OZE79197.1 esterase [Rhodococcus sp. 15-649-1-2]